MLTLLLSLNQLTLKMIVKWHMNQETVVAAQTKLFRCSAMLQVIKRGMVIVSKTCKQRSEGIGSGYRGGGGGYSIYTFYHAGGSARSLNSLTPYIPQLIDMVLPSHT